MIFDDGECFLREHLVPYLVCYSFPTRADVQTECILPVMNQWISCQIVCSPSVFGFILEFCHFSHDKQHSKVVCGGFHFALLITCCEIFKAINTLVMKA